VLLDVINVVGSMASISGLTVLWMLGTERDFSRLKVVPFSVCFAIVLLGFAALIGVSIKWFHECNKHIFGGAAAWAISMVLLGLGGFLVMTLAFLLGQFTMHFFENPQKVL
jgi:hypothetical protein